MQTDLQKSHILTIDSANRVPSEIPSSEGTCATNTASAARWLSDAALTLFAYGLTLPAGLGILIFLTQFFSPLMYGLYATVMSFTSVVILSLLAFLVRPAVRLVAESNDSLAAAGAVVRGASILGIAAIAVLWATADWVAWSLSLPSHAWILRLAALDVPLMLVGQVYLAVISALGQHRLRAITAGIRWPIRLSLTITFVLIGWGVTGAVVAALISSLVELCLAAFLVPLPWRASDLTLRKITQSGGPLAASAVANRTTDGGDTLANRWLGVDLPGVGAYAAAANLAIIPGLVAAALFPMILGEIMRLQRLGDQRGARKFSRTVVVAVAWMFVPALAGSLASVPVVELVFGQAYHASGSFLTVLVWASYGRMSTSLLAAILVALGRPIWCWWTSWPAAMIGLAGYAVLIPIMGAMGAAWAALAAGFLSLAMVSWLLTKRLQISLPLPTLLQVCGWSVLVVLQLWIWPPDAISRVSALTISLIPAAFFATRDLTTNLMQDRPDDAHGLVTSAHNC